MLDPLIDWKEFTTINDDNLYLILADKEFNLQKDYMRI